MNSLKPMIIILTAAAAVLFPVISSCAPPVPAVLYFEGFEYPPAIPWTPVNGWTAVQSWNIAAGGVSGNALEFPPSTALDAMISGYSGSNYKVSVRVRVAANTSAAGPWPIYVLARATDDNNFYAVGIYQDSGNCYLMLAKTVGGSNSPIQSVLLKTGAFDNSLFYTLTITVSGTSISGTCSGGGSSATVSGTAADFTGGRAGVMMWTNPGTYDVLFDDFTVTDY